MPHLSDRCCSIVELRQYTMVPGRRDELIELFEREFVDTQEAVGAHVIGTYVDLDDPDRFVWMRGFADLYERVVRSRRSTDRSCGPSNAMPPTPLSPTPTTCSSSSQPTIAAYPRRQPATAPPLLVRSASPCTPSRSVPTTRPRRGGTGQRALGAAHAFRAQRLPGSAGPRERAGRRGAHRRRAAAGDLPGVAQTLRLAPTASSALR